MRRSLLFVPGNSPKMMANCGFFGADAIIFDLEDAVSPDEKDAARTLVKRALANLVLNGCETIVRINAADTELWREDLEAVVPERPAAIMLPKTGCADDVAAVGAYIAEEEKKAGLPVGAIRLIALIETAQGVENAPQIAASCPRLEALFLGAEDLTADTRCRRTKEGQEITYARSRLVMAARAAGVAVYDTPFTDVNDDEGAAADAACARGMGFDGKATISPRHIALINRAFSPSCEEAAYAREVLEAIGEAERQGKGAVALRGKMIDAPVVARARQTLEAAEAIRKRGGELQ